MTKTQETVPDETINADAQEAAAELADAVESAAPQAPVDSQAARVAELEEALMRKAAELENFRKRSAKELDDAHKFAASKFAKDMMEVLDNLQRALDGSTEEQLAGHDAALGLRQGVAMTYDTLLSAFGRNGMEKIDPLHQPFDHHQHQALAKVETAEHAPNTVTAVMQAGYSMHGRVLRPAIVQVAAAPKE